MSKPREFYLHSDQKDIQTYEYFASETEQYDDDIHVIEKSAADRLAEALEYYAKQNHPIHRECEYNTDHARIALAEYRGEG